MKNLRDKDHIMNIIIAEPIPSLNKGEAAIFRGIQEALKHCGNHRVFLYSPPGWIEEDRDRYGNSATLVTGFDIWDAENCFRERQISRSRLYGLRKRLKLVLYATAARISKKTADAMFRDEFLAAFSGADLIIAGHDGMIGYNHFWVVLAAVIINKPIALYGGGNDFRGRSPRLQVRKFLQFMADKSIFFSVRDTNTKNYLTANDVEAGKIHVFPDPAVLLQPSPDRDIVQLLQKEHIPDSSVTPLYGVIPVRGGIVYEKSFSSESDPNKKHELRVAFWIELLLHILDSTNVHVVMIPHCIGPSVIFDDRRIMMDIYAALPKGKNRVTLIQNEYSEGDLKGLMKKCAYVLGERTHGLIGAVSVATPCAALTVQEDLRMHNIINAMFKRPVFNLNNPDTESIKKSLVREWNLRERTAAKMKAEVPLILDEASNAGRLLKQKYDQAKQSREKALLWHKSVSS